MGRSARQQGIATPKFFTSIQVTDRDLILRMLRHEDEIIHGEQGKMIYQRHENSLTSLAPEKTIHRVVLKEFGFDTSAESVEMYRTIFAYYYRSPADFDKEVMQAVTYMRENRTVFYTSPVIEVGSILPDAPILTLSDGKPTSIKQELAKHKFKFAFVGGFSTS